MNYAEVDLIHKNIFTSLNALKNGVPTQCSREIVEEIHILILTSSSQEILYSSAATKVGLSQSHSIVPVLAWVADTLYAEEGLLGRCNVCQYPPP